MNKVEPRLVAKWFISQNLDSPSNSRDGNMKLQKLLFFSQLIYMCQNNGKIMYDDEFNAFEHGMVLESVRLEYQNNFDMLYNESKESIDLPNDVLQALALTKEIFGSCSANELSDMSHQFKAWNKYFTKSLNKNGTYDKSKSKVPYNALKEELYKMEKVLTAYNSTSKLSIKEEEDY